MTTARAMPCYMGLFSVQACTGCALNDEPALDARLVS
jgi:hypothetical protein